MSDILYKYKKILIEDYNLDIKSIIKNLDSTDGNVFNIETYNYQLLLLFLNYARYKRGDAYCKSITYIKKCL